MEHVFVETNFIVDVARPFPSPDAEALMARAQPGGDVTLHLPWVAVAEAKRALQHIITEDLGFTNTMAKFAAREFLAGRLSHTEKQVIDALSARASTARSDAIQAIDAKVDAVAARTELIEPDKAVVTKVLNIFAVKSLKPFDEMVMGAVLARAAALYQQGERSLRFCNLNKKDFDPTNQPALAQEYAACGLRYQASFSVP